MTYITNIIKKARENLNFRTVLFTGNKSQLVIMNIPVSGEIGTEIHLNVEQTIFIVNGKANVSLDGKENELGPGDVVIVTPGVKHNVTNSGTESLLLYTVYTPPNHIEGRTHVTKSDADTDSEDKKFEEEATL